MSNRVTLSWPRFWNLTSVQKEHGSRNTVTIMTKIIIIINDGNNTTYTYDNTHGRLRHPSRVISLPIQFLESGRDLTSSGRHTYATALHSGACWVSLAWEFKVWLPWSITHPSSQCHCKIAYGSFCTWRQLALLFMVYLGARRFLNSQGEKKKQG